VRFSLEDANRTCNYHLEGISAQVIYHKMAALPLFFGSHSKTKTALDAPAALLHTMSTF
jgi:pseudouridine-5'-phosphate glycosidase